MVVVLPCVPGLLTLVGTGTVAGIWLNISISVLPSDTPVIQQTLFFKLLTTSFWDAAVAWCVHGLELGYPLNRSI